MHCVTQWSRYDNRWQGVSGRALLDLAMPRAEAKHVILHAYDTYTTNVTLEVFADPDVMLVHTWEGRPISREHGGPLGYGVFVKSVFVAFAYRLHQRRRQG